MHAHVQTILKNLQEIELVISAEKPFLQLRQLIAAKISVQKRKFNGHKFPPQCGPHITNTDRLLDGQGGGG